MRDLIGRSAKGDHLRQLRRLSASRLPSALLLEGDISTAPRQVAYGADPIAPSHSDTGVARISGCTVSPGKARTMKQTDSSDS